MFENSKRSSRRHALNAIEKLWGRFIKGVIFSNVNCKGQSSAKSMTLFGNSSLPFHEKRWTIIFNRPAIQYCDLGITG
jgi:hypothetical protein